MLLYIFKIFTWICCGSLSGLDNSSHHTLYIANELDLHIQYTVIYPETHQSERDLHIQYTVIYPDKYAMWTIWQINLEINMYLVDLSLVNINWKQSRVF